MHTKVPDGSHSLPTFSRKIDAPVTAQIDSNPQPSSGTNGDELGELHSEVPAGPFPPSGLYAPAIRSQRNLLALLHSLPPAPFGQCTLARMLPYLGPAIAVRSRSSPSWSGLAASAATGNISINRLCPYLKAQLISSDLELDPDQRPCCTALMSSAKEIPEIFCRCFSDPSESLG